METITVEQIENEASSDKSEMLEALIERIAAGDQNAMSDFYEYTVSKAYSVARAILGNESDTEEAVMDSYLQVWKSADRYTNERGKPLAWLLMIVRSRSLDLYRSRKQVYKELNMEAEQQDYNRFSEPEQVINLFDNSFTISKALGELSDIQLQVISLGFFRDLSHTQIANALNLPLGTVKSHANRAIASMRSYVNSKFSGGKNG